jgi:hypothetical protein
VVQNSGEALCHGAQVIPFAGLAAEAEMVAENPCTSGGSTLCPSQAEKPAPPAIAGTEKPRNAVQLTTSGPLEHKLQGRLLSSHSGVSRDRAGWQGGSLIAAAT